MPFLFTVIMPLFYYHLSIIILLFRFTVKRYCIVEGGTKGEQRELLEVLQGERKSFGPFRPPALQAKLQFISLKVARRLLPGLTEKMPLSLRSLYYANKN